jgi:hypothetical protein
VAILETQGHMNPATEHTNDQRAESILTLETTKRQAQGKSAKSKRYLAQTLKPWPATNDMLSN